MWTELERLAVMPDWLVVLDDRAALRTALAGHVSGLRDVRLRSIRFKPGAWRAGCELLLEKPDGDGADDTVLVMASIRPPATGKPPSTDPQTDLRPGDPGWRLNFPELRLELATARPDAADLPAMRMLTDPDLAQALLEEAIRTGTPAYPDLRIRSVEPHVMRYSPGSRCTILYRLTLSDDHPADWPDVVVAKTYHRSDKGQTAWHGMRALWTSPLGSSRTVSIAEPLAWLADDRILVQGPIRGDVTLKDLLISTLTEGPDAPLDELKRYLGKVAAGLAEMHTSGVGADRSATWEEELAEVREVGSELSEALPELAGALDPFLGWLEEIAAEVPPDAAVPSHRSFRPAQVLLDGERIGFIDFDGFCQAEPALDVALFRATMRDISLSVLPDDVSLAARFETVDELCDHFLDHYQALAPLSRQRVALWEALDLLTNVLHSWTKVKPERLQHAFPQLHRHAVGMLPFPSPAGPPAQVETTTGR